MILSPRTPAPRCRRLPPRAIRFTAALFVAALAVPAVAQSPSRSGETAPGRTGRGETARASAGQDAAQGAPDSLPAPRAIEFAGARAELPLRLLDARPVVEARIDGQGPFRMGIETGAAFIGLTRAALDSLRRSPSRVDAAGNIYALDSLGVAGVMFRGLEVRDAAPADPRIDGFLGLGAFESLLLTIDYPGQRVVLEHGGLPAPDGRTVLATQRVGPFFAVEVDLAGRRLPAVIDTRGSSAFGVTPAVGESLRFRAPPVVVGQARGAAIPVTDVKLGRLDGDARLGDIVFERPLVAIRALPAGYPDAIMGSEALSHFALTLDQRAGRVRFTLPAARPIPPPPPLTDMGLRLRPSPGDAPEVADVRPGTSADSAGVKPGDRVLEAGGIAGADLSPVRWRALANSGRPVALKLRRGKQTLDRVIAPAILVP